MRAPTVLISMWSVVLLIAACGTSMPTAPSAPSTPASQPLVVIDATGSVSPGYTIFVNTDQGKTNWLSTVPDGLMAAYPGGGWGFVAAVLAGPTALGSRPSKDFSGFRTLRIQLRGGSGGGEVIELGVKDHMDPDDGSESRKLIVLTSSWQTVDVPLADFKTADLKHLYLVEIVFNGATPRTVIFRDVQYLP